MTDQAQAMAKEIKVVFPNSRHRLCMWHIGENAKKNIKGLRAKKGFNDLFDIVLKYTDTIQEFENYWSRVDDNDVAEMGVTPCSVWRLYHIRTFITLVDRAQNDLSARAVIEEAIEECTARIKL
uniref:MULE transposase domain-containing protein n=1 Tax=Chenopodium quinoa TaxID=63459 RepID=A0A803N2X1_CHEQI